MAFSYRVEDNVGIVTLDRPERMNTLTRGTAVRLARLFDETDADDRVAR